MMHTERGRVMDWNADIQQSERGISFFGNTIVRILIGVNVSLILAGFAVLGFVVRPTSGLFVLHYNVYFGVEIQGAWWQVFIVPTASVLLLCGHLLLARHFYGMNERIAAYLALLGSCLIGIGVLIVSGGIAFINY